MREGKGRANAAVGEGRVRAGGVTQDRCPDRPNAPDRIKPQMTRLRLPTSSERDLRDYRLQTIVRIGAEGQLRIGVRDLDGRLIVDASRKIPLFAKVLRQSE